MHKKESPIKCYQDHNSKHTSFTGHLSSQEEAALNQLNELFLKIRTYQEDNANHLSIEEKIVQEYERIGENVDNGTSLEVKTEEFINEILDKNANNERKYVEMEEIVEAKEKEIKNLMWNNEKLLEELNFVLKREQNSKEKYEEETNYKIDEVNYLIKEISEKEQQSVQKLILSIKFLEKQLYTQEESAKELSDQNNELKTKCREVEEEIQYLKEENKRILQELKKKERQSLQNSKLSFVKENQFVFQEILFEEEEECSPKIERRSPHENSVSEDSKQENDPFTNELHLELFTNTSPEFKSSFPKVKKLLSLNKDLTEMKLEEKRFSNDYKSQSHDKEDIGENNREKIMGVNLNKKEVQPTLYRINSLTSLCSSSSKYKISQTLQSNLEETTNFYNKKSIGLMTEPNEELEESYDHKYSNNVHGSPQKAKVKPRNTLLANKNEMSKSYVLLHTSTSTCSNSVPVFNEKKPLQSQYFKSSHEIESKDPGVGSSIHGLVTSLVTMRTHKKKNQKNNTETEGIKKEEDFTKNRLSQSFVNIVKKTFNTSQTEIESEKKITDMQKKEEKMNGMRKNYTVNQSNLYKKEKKTQADVATGLNKNISSGVLGGIFDIVMRKNKK